MELQTSNFRTQLSASSLQWIALIIVLGGLTMMFVANQVDRQMRSELLGEAERLIETLDLQRLAALTALEADTQRPEYQRLKNQFQAFRQAFPRDRFVYLMARRPDETVVFQIDSEPAGSDDESPPGDVYGELSAEELQVFESGLTVVSGPAEDRWGVWVSALVPVRLPATSLNQVALGIDIDAANWRGQILRRDVAPIALATLVLLAIVACGQFLALRRTRSKTASSGLLRRLEAGMALAIGLTLTVTTAWIVHGESQASRMRSFELLAREATQGVSLGLRNLRDFGMGSLVRFFQASDFVSEEEFIHFTDLLAQNNLTRHWAWVPAVPVAERAAYERRIAAQDGSDFRIWEAEIEPPAATTGREFHFPITRQTKHLPELNLYGFDLASLGRLREQMETSRRSGLPTASTPMDGTHAPQLRGQILIIQATGPRLQRDLAQGVAVTSVAFDQFLAASTTDNGLAMDLWLLHEDGSRDLLARSEADQDMDDQDQNLDAFKPINDRFGHEVGDQLLVEVARRMQQAVRQGDTVARLGGDEFALVLVGLPDVDASRPLLKRVLEAVAKPVEHEGHVLEISASLGISFYPRAMASRPTNCCARPTRPCTRPSWPARTATTASMPSTTGTCAAAIASSSASAGHRRRRIRPLLSAQGRHAPWPGGWDGSPDPLAASRRRPFAASGLPADAAAAPADDPLGRLGDRICAQPDLGLAPIRFGNTGEHQRRSTAADPARFHRAPGRSARSQSGCPSGRS